jgi:hypothetical protein
MLIAETSRDILSSIVTTPYGDKTNNRVLSSRPLTELEATLKYVFLAQEERCGRGKCFSSNAGGE